MVLSGFLMTYHWIGREGKFNNHCRQSIDFYLRRFFRIAPLYYLLFTIAFFGKDFLSLNGSRRDGCGFSVHHSRSVWIH